MAYAKWIGGFLGLLNGGILGALAGFAIGAIIDSFSDDNAPVTTDGDALGSGAGNMQQEGERNGFLFSLLVLSAHIIKADGRIMHSEMELMRKFLRNNFGEVAVGQGEQILLRLFDYHKRNGNDLWQAQIRQACDEMARVMPQEQRLQLMSFLCEVAKADGHVDGTEINSLRQVAVGLQLDARVIDQMLSLGGTTLDDAYKVLGLTPQATDEEVRKAYRKMALQYHPDRVATLGEDVREAAKRKFQEINDAKERIYKARNL